MLADPRIANGLKRQFALREELLPDGPNQPGPKRPNNGQLGWKVGFGAPAALESLGLTAPLVGFMPESGRLAPGAEVSLAGWTKPAAEPEIAVFIGNDLGANAAPAEIAAAIAGLAPAIEVVDATRPPDDVEEILAVNIFHRHVVLGPCDETRAGAKLDGMVAHITRNGEAYATVEDLEANTGKIADTVRLVADTAAAMGDMLRAGQVIIAGSLVPAVFLEDGDTEFALDLTPLGSVSVSFR